MEDIQTSLFAENQGNLEAKIENPSTEREFQKEYTARIARIALPRFPEFQRRGERNKDVTRRLKSLRKAGFSVESYSTMTHAERWNLLMSYRAIIYREAWKYCPDVVMEIKRRNNDSIDTKERDYLLR